MKNSFRGLLVVGILLSAFATIAVAHDAKDEAIKKDRKQIEGTWRIVSLVINGDKTTVADPSKLTVVNGSDGSWILRTGSQEMSRGTSSFDPTAKPKAIDFKQTQGSEKDTQYLGIYELGENTRKLCFAPPGKPRPTEFVSPLDSGYILVTFERVKAK